MHPESLPNSDVKKAVRLCAFAPPEHGFGHCSVVCLCTTRAAFAPCPANVLLEPVPDTIKKPNNTSTGGGLSETYNASTGGGLSKTAQR